MDKSLLDNNISFITKIECIVLGLSFLFLIIAPEYSSSIQNITLLTIIFCFVLNRNNTIIINPSIVLWFIFIILNVIGLLFNKYRIVGDTQYITSLILMLFVLIVLNTEKNWTGYLIHMIKFASLVAVIGSILQLIAPNILTSINALHFMTYNFNSYLSFSSRNILVGFTNNPGINGYYISIALIITFIKLFYNRRSLTIIVFIFILYLLFLTNKRGFIIFIMLIILYLISRMQGTKLKAIFPIISLILVFTGLLLYTEIGQGILERSFGATDLTTLTTGRWPVYEIMWEDFKEAPVMGKGTYSTIEVINLHNGHNIYMQVLREHGVIGFIVFVSFLILNFIKTDSLFRIYGDKINKQKVAVAASLQILFILWGLTGNPLYDSYALLGYIMGVSISWKLSQIPKENFN